MQKALVAHAANPYTLEETNVSEVKPNTTVGDYVRSNNIDLTATPTVIKIDDEFILQKHIDDTIIEAGQKATFIQLPQNGGGGSEDALKIVAGIALMVGAPYLAPMLGVSSMTAMVAGGVLGTALISSGLPSVPSYDGYSGAGSIAASSPTYSFGSIGNSSRIGKPVPVVFGRHMITHDYAAAPYTEYEFGEQYLVLSLMCGAGDIEVEKTFIADQAISIYGTDIESHVIEPSQNQIYATNIVTSDSVSNIEILAPNEDGDYTPHFVACKAGAEISQISFDYTVPGLIHIDDSGAEKERTITWQEEVAQVNDSGDIISDWEIISTDPVYVTRTNISSKQIEYQTKYETTKSIDYSCYDYNYGGDSGSNRDYSYSEHYINYDYIASVELNSDTANNFRVSGHTVELINRTGKTYLLKITKSIKHYEDGRRLSNDCYSSTSPIRYHSLDDLDVEHEQDKTFDIEYDYQFSPTARPGQASITDATTDQLRFTKTYSLPSGRYVARVKRIDEKDKDIQSKHDIYLTSLRGHLTKSTDNSDFTMLQLRIRATNNLSNKNYNKIKSIVKAPQIQLFGSSIASAVYKVLHSDTGGLGLNYYERSNTQQLSALDAIWAERGDEFNAVIDSQMPAESLLEAILLAGRSRHYQYMGQISYARANKDADAVAYFAPEDCVKGSLNISYLPHMENSPTGIKCTYVDAIDDRFAQESVVAETGQSNGIHAETTVLGVTNRLQAYNESLHAAYSHRYGRQRFSLKTEMKGFIPKPLQVIEIEDGDLFDSPTRVVIDGISPSDNYHAVLSGYVVQDYTLPEALKPELPKLDAYIDNDKVIINDPSITGDYQPVYTIKITEADNKGLYYHYLATDSDAYSKTGSTLRYTFSGTLIKSAMVTRTINTTHEIGGVTYPASYIDKLYVYGNMPA